MQQWNRSEQDPTRTLKSNLMQHCTAVKMPCADPRLKSNFVTLPFQAGCCLCVMLILCKVRLAVTLHLQRLHPSEVRILLRRRLRLVWFHHMPATVLQSGYSRHFPTLAICLYCISTQTHTYINFTFFFISILTDLNQPTTETKNCCFSRCIFVPLIIDVMTI